ncbi:acid-sensing ion channel 1C-like [Babylonia areolata]|uniref:acid-sensing ion channel 1C-like n=1 Tax=Babylonia areolata TaxID=304850 RepID=UPI003FD2D39B
MADAMLSAQTTIHSDCSTLNGPVRWNHADSYQHSKHPEIRELHSHRTAASHWTSVWAVAVLGMLCAMIYTLYSMLSAYDQYPVNTVTKVTAKGSLPFPGITLCNLNEVDKSLIPFNGTLFQDIRVTLRFGFAFPPLNESDPEVSRILGAPIDSLVNSSWILPGQGVNFCVANDRMVDCSQLLIPFQTSRTMCVTLNTSYAELPTMTNAGPNSGLQIYLSVHQDGYFYPSAVSAGVKCGDTVHYASKKAVVDIPV